MNSAAMRHNVSLGDEAGRDFWKLAEYCAAQATLREREAVSVSEWMRRAILVRARYEAGRYDYDLPREFRNGAP